MDAGHWDFVTLLKRLGLLGRHPALTLLRVAGLVFVLSFLVAGVFSWRSSRLHVKSEILGHLRLESRMLAGFLRDEGRQLRLVSAMARRGQKKLLQRYLRLEATRISVFALYDARGRLEKSWGQEASRAPPRLPVSRLRHAPRFRNDRWLSFTPTSPSLLLLARRARNHGWAVFFMKRALLVRLLFLPLEFSGVRLDLRSARSVLVRRAEGEGAASRSAPSFAFLQGRPLDLTVPLASPRTNLMLAARVPPSVFRALWWRRYWSSVVLFAVLLFVLVLLERSVRSSLVHERALQQKKEEAAMHDIKTLAKRVDTERQQKIFKEAERLLSDAVAHHLPEPALFRRAVEILDNSLVGTGFWFAVHDAQGFDEATQATTASGWSLLAGRGVDVARLARLYTFSSGPPSAGESPGERCRDPIRQLFESGTETSIERRSAGDALDPLWSSFLESSNASGLWLFPISREALLVGQFGLLVPQGPEEEVERDGRREFAREVARILSYGLADLAARQALEYAGLHDPLTGVPNRRLFYDRIRQLEQSLERDGAPFALAILDLDDFKAINDVHGHLVGDRVLAELATRLRNSLRTCDTVARLGGDEFGLLLTGLTPEFGHAFLERLRASVARPFTLRTVSLDVGISLGFAYAPRDGTEHDALVRAADSALYHAKKNGGGRWLIYDDKRDAHTLRPV
jgi:diguanylate cyclase (GGDEF)-like protein